jgi:hypothetical protein
MSRSRHVARVVLAICSLIVRLTTHHLRQSCDFEIKRETRPYENGEKYILMNLKEMYLIKWTGLLSDQT